jgi:hypothetical protein
MAREPIDMNTVAPEARTYQGADVYSRPYWDKNAGSGFMELAKSLGVLGDTLAAKQAKASHAQGQADYAYYDSIAQELGEGNNANQIKNQKSGIFDLFSFGKGSAITRNKVEEVTGDRAATQDFYTKYGTRLLPFENDREGLTAEIAKIKKEAWAEAHARKGGDPRAYGDSYFKQLDQLTNSFQGAAFTKQAAEFEAQADLTLRDKVGGTVRDGTKKSNVNLTDFVEGSDNSLFSYLAKDKPQSYIQNLDKNFSGRIQNLIASAPP